MKSSFCQKVIINQKLKSIGWTPLHTRILAHRVGDGSINHYGHLDWSNKHVDHFLRLAKHVNIKCWGPTISDKYGTQKVIIHKKHFQGFSSLFGLSTDQLLGDSVILLDAIAQLPEAHRLQSLLAFIVDDGSCSSWMPLIFEDKNRKVFYKVKELWDKMFPDTSSVRSFKTKHGTKIYCLSMNRIGIISLKIKIRKAVKLYGRYADLWWKQNSFDNRYNKAVSKRAKELYETINNMGIREKLIVSFLKNNKYMRFTDAKQILGISKFRTHRTLHKLIKTNKIHLIDAGNRARYSLQNEDISFNARKNIILNYLTWNNKIYRQDCCRLLRLGKSQLSKILKRLQIKGFIRHIKEKGKTYYILP